MKYLIFSFVVLLISCQRDPEVITPRLPDKITYLDIKDDTLENLTGRDTLISRLLDVNSDNKADFSIKLNTYLCPYQGTPSGGPCTYHFTKVIIGANQDKSRTLSTNYFKNNSGSNPPQIKFFNQGDVIHKSTGYNGFNINYLYSNDGRWFNYSYSGEAYIGFYIEEKYHGWIKIKGFGNSSRFILMEIAVNMTENNSIIAGQKE